MIRSMRGRLLLGAVMGTCAVVLVSGGLIYASARARLWAEFDEALAVRGRALASLVERDSAGLELEVDYGNMPEFDRSDRPEYFQIWQRDGVAVARSRSLGEQNLPLPVGPIESLAAEFVRLPDGRPGRAVHVLTHPREESDELDEADPAPAGTEIVVAVATGTVGVEETLRGVRRILALLAALIVVLSAGALTLVVRRGLGPLDALARQIASLRPDDTATRVALPGAPTELMPVVERLNELLDRTGAAIQRERSFTADAAHELRTPLAGLRSTLEIALSRRREPEAYQAAMSECLRIALQMHAMTNSLLSLARLETDRVALRPGAVPLKALLEECWGPLADRARAKGAHISWTVGAPLVVHADQESLRQVINNLLENAVSHVDVGGQISIDARLDAGAARLEVANSGSAVSTEDAEHVFERFWRGNAAREGTGAHFGLGLALAKRLVELLGGRIRARSQRGGRFIIVLTLPIEGHDNAPSTGDERLPEPSESIG